MTDSDSESTWAAPPDSWASSAATRRSMQGNRSRDTQPELAVRRLVHAAGLRYYVNRRIPGVTRRSADLVFPRTKVAVFIDGCFWHGCPKHYIRPKTNPDYWTAKIEGNRRRDAATDQELAEAGWLVLRFWEHQPALEVASKITDAVRARRN